MQLQPQIFYSWFHIVFYICITFLISEAIHQVIVDNSGNLHEGINHGWPDTSEPSPDQILAHGLCFRRLYGYLTSISKSVSYRLLVNKAPTVVAKGTKFLLNLWSGVKRQWKRRDSAINHLKVMEVETAKRLPPVDGFGF